MFLWCLRVKIKLFAKLYFSLCLWLLCGNAKNKNTLYDLGMWGQMLLNRFWHKTCPLYHYCEYLHKNGGKFLRIFALIDQWGEKSSSIWRGHKYHRGDNLNFTDVSHRNLVSSSTPGSNMQDRNEQSFFNHSYPDHINALVIYILLIPIRLIF